MVLVALCCALVGCGSGEASEDETTTVSRPVTTGAPVTVSTTAEPDSSSTTGASVTTSTTVVPATTSTSAVTETTSTTKAPITTTTSVVSGVPAKEYSRVPTKEKVVALTFDAAYDPSPLGDILAALEDAGATAGHPIGNHSYSHPDFTAISDAKVRDELRRTAAAIEEAGAGDPRPLFRPPYGARDKRVLRLLASEGYVSVYWAIDTLDWKPERTAAQIRETVLDKLQPGAIVLMHVGGKETAKMLPGLLKDIAAKGYRCVNLREALP
jgi:peptidoglycan/xylan/chitin deacetylase (PgdA/CDA1 family)